MIKAIELFGGIGAATQALKRQFGKENVEIVDYVELDKHAVKSYNAINGTNFVPTDINDIDMGAYPEVDVVIAGWPCQDYSVAGKGLGLEGTRSNLILLTISKIKEMTNKPKHILLENVKGLLSKKHIDDLDYIKELFDELGYNWNQAMLNSKYFGVPQARERVFMLLTRKDLPMKRIDHLEQRNTIHKVLSDVLDFTEPTQTIEIKTLLESDYGKGVKMEYSNYIYLPPKNVEKPLNNLEGRRLWKTDKYVGTIPAGSPPKIYFTNEMSQYNGKIIELDTNKLDNQERDKINKVATLGTLEIGGFKDHTFNQKKHFLGIDGVAKTLRAGDCDAENKVIFKDVSFNQDKSIHGIDGQAPTLTTSGTAYNENTIIHYRKLSTLECWRLMGFNDEAHNKCKEIGVSNSQLAKQAGNSIVVNVLEAIFEELFNK